MGLIRYLMRVFCEAFWPSLNITKTIIFVLFICTGLAIYLYPPARMVVEWTNLGGWQGAAKILCVIVVIRFFFASYLIFKDENTQLIATKETLSRISEDRPFSYVNIAPRVRTNNFNIWTVEKIELLFDNLSERTISYKIIELFCEIEGNRRTIPLPPNAGGYIHARQRISYGFEPNDLTVRIFPAIIIIGFCIEYDNVPPLKKRGTKSIIRHTFRSFAPMDKHWNTDIINQDEYWVS
ncbi:MAG: hypothetical protein AB1424_12560 [Thermodesulfobacteriota bacterium]